MYTSSLGVVVKAVVRDRRAWLGTITSARMPGTIIHTHDYVADESSRHGVQSGGQVALIQADIASPHTQVRVCSPSLSSMVNVEAGASVDRREDKQIT